MEFTLEYWKDCEWLVGRLIEAPGVFSQGKTLAELEANIREAYELMREDDLPQGIQTHTKAVLIEA